MWTNRAYCCQEFSLLLDKLSSRDNINRRDTTKLFTSSYSANRVYPSGNMIVMYVFGDLTIMCALLLLAGRAQASGNDCIYFLLTDQALDVPLSRRKGPKLEVHRLMSLSRFRNVNIDTFKGIHSKIRCSLGDTKRDPDQ